LVDEMDDIRRGLFKKLRDGSLYFS
jgi:hypothetical protein